MRSKRKISLWCFLWKKITKFHHKSINKICKNTVSRGKHLTAWMIYLWHWNYKKAILFTLRPFMFAASSLSRRRELNLSSIPAYMRTTNSVWCCAMLCRKSGEQVRHVSLANQFLRESPSPSQSEIAHVGWCRQHFNESCMQIEALFPQLHRGRESWKTSIEEVESQDVCQNWIR